MITEDERRVMIAALNAIARSKEQNVRTAMSDETQGPFELDHATDAGNRHFIIHGKLPPGLNAEYGYPICDSLNRHHCVSPEEDEANGKLFAAAWNLREALILVWNSLTEGQQGCSGHFDAKTMVLISYETLGKVRAALIEAGKTITNGNTHNG
jgi:hypothetical protein